MANTKYGPTMVETSNKSMDDTEEVLMGGPGQATQQYPTQQYGKQGPVLGESEYEVSEASGDAVSTVPTVESFENVAAGPHQEVGIAEGAEAGEEYYEATPAQMAAAEAGEESAVSDLVGLEGFELQESAVIEAAPSTQLPLRDAGAGLRVGGQEEFFPILAALAPTLISTVGPMVAKGVLNKLGPKAKKVVKRLPKLPIPSGPLGATAKSLVTAANGGGGATSVLALLAKLVQTAQKPTPKTGEAGMEVDEAFIEEVAATIEAIVDTDDRVRITPTTQEPWRRICALRITFPSGSTYRGTGFLIGTRAVVTAGHCVFLHDQGGWARKVEIIPGCNGTQRPFGQAESSVFRSVTGWVKEKKPECDYGCIILPPGAFGGRNLGKFGFSAWEAPALLALPAVVAGYPGDKPFAELWGAARRLKAVTAKTLVYNTATMGGQSGAPVYIKRNGQRYAVGIHNYGASTGNSATRITKEVYARLLAWSKL